MVTMATVQLLEHQMKKLRSRDVDDISKVTQQADSNSLQYAGTDHVADQVQIT